jgi:hypothetical protein
MVARKPAFPAGRVVWFPVRIEAERRALAAVAFFARTEGPEVIDIFRMERVAVAANAFHISSPVDSASRRFRKRRFPPHLPEDPGSGRTRADRARHDAWPDQSSTRRVPRDTERAAGNPSSPRMAGRTRGIQKGANSSFNEPPHAPTYRPWGRCIPGRSPTRYVPTWTAFFQAS